MAFSPDGALLATSSKNGRTRLWELNSGKVRATLQPSATVFGLDFATDGNLLAAATGGWHNELWNVQAATLVRTLRGHSGGSYCAISFAPDGKTLATGSVDKTVRLWQCSTGQELMVWPFPAHVRSLAFARDGSFLQVATCDGRLTVFPAAPAQQVLEDG